MKFDVGNEFDVITVSFDPHETPDMATKKKRIPQALRTPRRRQGLALSDRPAESINALTKAVGFQYQYDPKTGQYAHATAIMVLTPAGKIAQYFYGVDYPPKDLRMGLVEASQNKIGNAGGSGAPVLLSLRSDHREIRRHYFARAATVRAGDHPGSGSAHDRC